MRTKYSRYLFILSVSLFLSNCTQSQLEHAVMSYNKAISEYGNQEILLNAIRASKRHPLYFSHLDNITGQPSVTGDISSQFSLNPFRLLSYSVSPKTSLRPAFSAASISALDSEEFNNAILKPVDEKIIIHNFLEKGWPLDLVVMIFVQEVTIPSSEFKGLETNIKYACKYKIPTAYGDAQIFCDLGIKVINECGEGGLKFFFKKDIRHVKLRNDPEEKCKFLWFRYFATLLRAVETKFFIETVQGKKDKIEKKIVTTKRGYNPEEGRRIHYTETMKEFGKKSISKFLNAEIFNYEKKRFVTLRDDKSKKGPKIGVDIVIRSPDGLLYYVGELIRVQLKAKANSFLPQFITSDGDEAPLFWVKKGQGFTQAAVSVTHRGETYYVPKTKYMGNSHRSMQVINLIKQVFDLNIKNEDKPDSPLITLPLGS